MIRALAVLLLHSLAFAAEDPLGAGLYRKHCASCHDAPSLESRIPAKSTLQAMRAAAILQSLETGVMRQQAAALSRTEKRSVAAFLGTSSVSVADRSRFANPCPPSSFQPDQAAPSWTNWGAGLNNWRHQSTSILTASNIPRLRLKWAFGFPDATTVRSQPAVFGGRIFIGSQDGTIYSLDASTGCQHWATTVAAQVRSGITIAALDGRVILLAGDTGGFLHALDAATGTPLWKARPEPHPAAMISSTPVVHNGRVFFGISSYEEASALSPGHICCSFRGSVVALDAATGKLIWKTFTIVEPAKPGPLSKRGKPTMGPSGAGVWSAPTLDPAHGLLYVTTGDNYSDPPTPTSDAVIALAISDGQIHWTKQLLAGDAFNSSCTHPEKYNCPDTDGPDFDLGASAILLQLPGGSRTLILAQKSGMLHAVDPDRKGEIQWQSRVGKGGVLGGIQWGPATDGTRIYVALSDIAFTRAYPNGPERPIRTLDDKSGGGLFAFNPRNGERLWQTPAPPCSPKPCSPAQSAAITSLAGVVFSGSVDGRLRAYSSIDGKIIWEYNTAWEFTTVNKVPAQGGSMDVGGPVIAGGMLFAGAGYGQWGGIAGNVLLAFEVNQEEVQP